MRFKVNIRTYLLENKYSSKNQLSFPPFAKTVELTETDVPSVSLTSDQRKSEHLLVPERML